MCLAILLFIGLVVEGGLYAVSVNLGLPFSDSILSTMWCTTALLLLAITLKRGFAAALMILFVMLVAAGLFLGTL